MTQTAASSRASSRLRQGANCHTRASRCQVHLLRTALVAWHLVALSAVFAVGCEAPLSEDDPHLHVAAVMVSMDAAGGSSLDAGSATVDARVADAAQVNCCVCQYFNAP